MDLRDMILEKHSKAQTNKIVAWVGDSQEKLDELVQLLIGNDPLIAQRAGWPLGYIAEAHPALINKHLEKLLQNLERPRLHNAVKRNTLRIFQDREWPESLHGQLMDICFRYIEDPTEAVAIKAFALRILQNFGKQYPEILPEIKIIVEAQLPRQTAAFKVRARPFL